MLDFVAFCFFTSVGGTAGKALADFDRMMFVRNSSWGDAIFLVLRVMAVSAGIWWLTIQIAPESYAGNRSQWLISLLMLFVTVTYALEMIGLGNWLRVKAWK